VVKDIKEAIQIITKFDSKHTESILTENEIDARNFLEKVDAAAVYVNASTRLTDGGVFGMGGRLVFPLKNFTGEVRWVLSN
jgi:glutamate-5-semialdehyde dehydrogenase